MNPERRIPFEMLNRFIHKTVIWVNRATNPIIYKKHYDVLFGAYIPEIDYNVGEPSEECLQQFVEWAESYPRYFVVTDQ